MSHLEIITALLTSMHAKQDATIEMLSIVAGTVASINLNERDRKKIKADLDGIIDNLNSTLKEHRERLGAWHE